MFVTYEPGYPQIEIKLQNIYQLYTDYVLKNPFYTIDNVIKCSKFDLQLKSTILTEEHTSVHSRA